MRILLLCILLCSCICAAQAQKRLLIGGFAGIGANYMVDKANENHFTSTSLPYAGAQLDYQFTSRLSLTTQLYYQQHQYNELFAGGMYENVRVNMKRLFAGFTEYLPVGNHAAHINMGLTLSHFNGTGVQGGRSINLFTEGGFQPWQFGWGIQLGYTFHFGLYLQTGFTSDFTAMYNKLGSNRLKHDQFQFFQLGFMPGFKKRDNGDTWNRRSKRVKHV